MKRFAPALGMAAGLAEPSVRLMNRLTYPRKFVAIAVALLIPLAYVGYAYLGDEGSKIGFAQKEQIGVRYVQPANALLEEISKGRTLAVRAAAGDAGARAPLGAQRSAIQQAESRLGQADARYGGTLQTTAMWSKLHSAIDRVIAVPATGPAATLQAWNSLTAGTVGLITQAGNTSNLILDPDLDSFYVMDGLVVKTPALIDAAGGAGALNLVLDSTGGGRALSGRIQLAVAQGTIANVAGGMGSDVSTALANTHDSALRGDLASRTAAVTGSSKHLGAALSATVAGTGSGTASASAGDQAAASTAELAQAMAPSLDRLLAHRIAGFSAAKLRVEVVTAVALAVALYLVLGFYLSALRGAGQLTALAQRIEEGDVESEADVESRDELGRAMSTLSGSLADYMREITAAARSVADGDLTVQVSPRSSRDALGDAVAGMLENLRSIIADVAAATEQVESSTGQMIDTTQQAARAASEIAQATEEVARGAEQQVQIVVQARSAADETQQAVSDASGVADEGAAISEAAGEAMDAMSETANRISEEIAQMTARSKEIGGIVEVIGSIAEQTNLLALNAAIEAARAGEHGRGFAVVAEEVRKLAEESQRSASRISGLIAEMQATTDRVAEAVGDGVQRTEAGVEAVARAREAFSAIGLAVSGVSQRIAQIVALADEVGVLSESSSSAAEQVSASTQQTSASTQEISASAEQLGSVASGLTKAISRFRVS